MKRRVALTLHGWAYRLAPEIGQAVRQAVIQQLAAEHQAEQQAIAQRLAAHRERVSHIARNQ